MDPFPLISAFALILLAELGDKTQLLAIMLSSRHSAFPVFLGAMLAFLVVDGTSVIVGGALLGFLPLKWVTLGSGLVFILFGVLTVIRKEKEEFHFKERGFPLFTAFSLVSLMELGDKTQLAAIALSAQSASPLLVLVGVMLAFLVITGIGVVLGARILRLLPTKYLKMGTSALFIVFGTVFVVSSITGISIL